MYFENFITFISSKKMKVTIAFIISFCIITSSSRGQVTAGFIPKNIDTTKIFLFYLHGAIVQEEGPNAVSKDFGPYEYYRILDTFKSYGYYVISEARPKGTEGEKYGDKVARQVDTLLKSGVPATHIIVVGASQGAAMTIEAAYRIKNSQIKYVLLGLCSDYMIEYYLKYKKELCGNFLSIYESSDAHSSCDRLLMEQYCKSGYKEIRLNMGISHGFIYKPYKEWVSPIVQWINNK